MIKTKNNILNWLENSIEEKALGEFFFEGLWGVNLAVAEDFWLSQKFWTTLEYASAKKESSISNLIHVEDRKLFISACEKIKNDSKIKTLSCIVRFYSKTGVVWLKLRGKVIKQKEGDCKIVGSATSVNQIKEKEQFLENKIVYYKNVIEGGNVATWEYNFNTGFVTVNEHYANIIGYTVEELQPLTVSFWKSFIYPEDLILIQEIANSLNEKIEPFEIEFRIKHKKGHWVWVLCSGNVTKRDENNKVVLISGFFYDITTRKNNELLVLNYSNLMKRINSVAKVGLWEMKIENQELAKEFSKEIDSNILSFLGYSKPYKPLKNGSMLDVIQPGPHKNAHIKVIKKALTEGKEYDVKLPLISQPNNTVKWARIVGIPEFKNGKCTRLYGFLQDVDKETKISQELALKEQELRHNFEQAAIGMGVIDLENNLTKANTSLVNIFGYTKEEAYKVSYQEIMHPEDYDITMPLIKEIIEGKRSSFAKEVRGVSKFGKQIWLHMNMSVVKNDKGEISHMLNQMLDITAKKQAELKLADYSKLMFRINIAAKIGIWEIDLKNRTVIWDATIKKMLGVSEDYIATIEEDISYFKEGYSQETISNLVKRAISEGENFDVLLQVKSPPKNKYIWTRTTGIVEFKNGICTRLYGFFQDVDEETRVSKELAVKEEELRHNFEQSAIGLVLVNLDGKAEKANKAMLQITGCSEEDFNSDFSFCDVVISEEKEKVDELFNSLLKGKVDSVEEEIQAVHKKGHRIWLNVILSTVKNSKGEVTHILSQNQDITDKKRNELKLADFSNLMTRINLAAKIGIWELNIEKKTVFWDNSIKEFLGTPKNYAPTLEEEMLLFKEGYSRDTFTMAIKNALENGVGFEILLEVYSKRRKKYIWTRKTGIVEFSNGVCTRLYGFCQDVDKETRVSKELAVKEEEFRNTFKQATIGMVFIGLNCKILKVNIALTKIVGYSAEEMLTLSYGDLAHPEDREKTQVLLKEVLNNKQDSVNGEIRVIHKKGYIIWVAIVISAVKNDNGKLLHMLLQIQDITKNKSLTQNLKEHNNRLVNFAHIVSHNLRSHASNISMLLDLTSKDYPNLMENDFLKNIKIVSDNMNNTIYDLNKIVEINSNISANLSPYKLVEYVKKSIQNINSQIEEAKAEITVDVPENTYVLAIQAYLESIVLNLITNAVKYRMPERPLKIKIKAKLEWNFVVFSVEDNGLGIDLNRHGAKLFGLYKVFHANKDAKGIGLFLVKNQIETMGGKIKVESKEDVGTKFTVYFKLG